MRSLDNATTPLVQAIREYETALVFEMLTARLKGGGFSFSERRSSIAFPPDISPVLHPTHPESFWNRDNIPDPTD